MCTDQDLVPNLPSTSQSVFALAPFPNLSPSKNAILIDAPVYMNPTLPHIIASHAQNRPKASDHPFSRARGSS